ncbi:MAG: hypothetical protein WCA20_00040 [Candidatus Sulfotelmatobacter sp.]
MKRMNIDQRLNSLLRREKRLNSSIRRLQRESAKTGKAMKKLEQSMSWLGKLERLEKKDARKKHSSLENTVREITTGSKALLRESKRAKKTSARKYAKIKKLLQIAKGKP